jgi:predicted nucleic acid-binding protein
MSESLVDTNILLRSSDPGSPFYTVAIDAVAQLLARGERLLITAQNLIEFWAVATRLVSSNGLGWSVQKTKEEIDRLLLQFPLIQDSPAILVEWLNLVSTHGVQGKAVHDVRLVAVMRATGIACLLTFNTADFTRYLGTGIVLIHPNDVVGGQQAP